MKFSRKICLTLAVLLPAGAALAESLPRKVKKQRSVGRALENAQSQAFVTSFPFFRIFSYQRRGLDSLLREASADDKRGGLRLVALERVDGRQVELPFDHRANWLESDAKRLLLATSAGSGDQKVQLRAEIFLREETGQLEVKCRITHEGSAGREIALWAIAAVPPEGWLITPIAQGLENRQRVHGKIISFWNSPLNAPCLQLGANLLALDLSRWPQSPPLKFGTRSNAAWIAAVRPDRNSLLLLRAAYDPADRYPDQDCNMTLWCGSSPDGEAYAEIEALSPWTIVKPKKELKWSFVLEQKTLSSLGEATPETVAKAVRVPELYGPDRPSDANSWRFAAEGPLVRDAFGKVMEWRQAKGAPLAQSPLWYNAPEWSADGPSLVWNLDTLVEPISQTLPPWSEKGRAWSLSFAPAAGDDPRLLFQEGNFETGFAMVTQKKDLIAVLWNRGAGKSLQISRLSGPLPAGRCTTSASYVPEKKHLVLSINGEPQGEVAVPEEVRPMPARLVIGRNAQFPKELELQDPQGFAGRLYRLTITPDASLKDE